MGCVTFRSPCSSIPTYLQKEEDQANIILSILFWTSDECFRKQHIMCTKKCVPMWMVNKNNSCNLPPSPKKNRKHAHYSWSEDKQVQWIYKTEVREPQLWKHMKMEAIKCPCCYGAKKYLNTDTKSTYFTHHLHKSTQNTNMPQVSSEQKCVHYGMKCSLMKIAEVQFLGKSSLLCIDLIINRVV